MKDRLTLRVERDPVAFGPEWDPLFASGVGLQSGRAWLAASIAAALPSGSTPTLLALTDESGPLALVPMLAGPGRSWGSLTTPYTCLYQPLVRRDPALAHDALDPIGHYCRQWPITRFEALDPDDPGVDALRTALSRAGLMTRHFANFGNWHEDVTGGSWEQYLEQRPGALRETIRRRTRLAMRSGARIEIARDQPALSTALDAYESVYRQSWKQPEPFPDFNAALVRNLAEQGALRISVMWSGDRAVAAQYWSVDRQEATVLKLAHDEKLKLWSPGTVLTAATIRELMDVDRVRRIDFGRGDDAYKRGWVSQRRPRVGLLGLNVRTITGMRALLTHDAGALRRRLSIVGNAGVSCGREKL